MTILKQARVSVHNALNQEFSNHTKLLAVLLVDDTSQIHNMTSMCRQNTNGLRFELQMGSRYMM